MHHRRLQLSIALVFSGWLGLATVCPAQTVVYNSGGFEGFNLDTLSPQDTPPWQTTDFSQLVLGNPAGVVQSATTFAGARAVQIIGPNLFDDASFSNSTFWWQDRTTSPINPVLSGTPIIRTTYRQFMPGTSGDTSQIPLSGVYFEGLTTGGTQLPITSVFIDFAERITALTSGGNSVSSPVIPGLLSDWQDLRVDLNFQTNRFTVFRNGVAVQNLNNIPFRTPGMNRLVEMGFQASTLGVGVPPTNDAFFDDYLVVGVAAVPEPGAFVLIGLSLATAASVWSHRRRKLVQATQADVVN